MIFYIFRISDCLTVSCANAFVCVCLYVVWCECMRQGLLVGQNTHGVDMFLLGPFSCVNILFRFLYDCNRRLLLIICFLFSLLSLSFLICAVVVVVVIVGFLLCWPKLDFSSRVLHIVFVSDFRNWIPCVRPCFCSKYEFSWFRILFHSFIRANLYLVFGSAWAPDSRLWALDLCAWLAILLLFQFSNLTIHQQQQQQWIQFTCHSLI